MFRSLVEGSWSNLNYGYTFARSPKSFVGTPMLSWDLIR